MSLINNTQDLLYVILSLSVLWFTIFLCWLLYQAARVLRNANDIIENVSKKLELLVDAVEFIREKVEGLTSTAGILSKIIGGLAEKLIVGRLGGDDKFDLEERLKKRKKK